jgi:hypothetical protein
MASEYRWDSTQGSAEPFREWHRGWGRSLYATDFDFVEYTFQNGMPKVCGMFEYKHFNAAPIGRKNPQVALMAEIASKVGVPGFFVRYTTDKPYTFAVHPLNKQAAEVTNGENIILSERRYTDLLHFIRGEFTPQEIADSLSTETAAVTFPVDVPPFVMNHT